MDLIYKPDLKEAQQRWRAFWEREIIDRPCTSVIAPKDGVETVSPPDYLDGWDGDFEEAAKRFEAWAAATYFGGEAIPVLTPSFGPDQFAAFLGGRLHRSSDSQSTTWVDPFVNNWSEVLPFQLTMENQWWQKMLCFYETLAEVGKGKFLAGMLDFHSNFDCLSAIRGAENICFDIYDRPDEIDQTMRSVRQVYTPMYESIYSAGRMAGRGTIGWINMYCEEKYAVIQCDTICLLSPEHARRYIIPALEEEASFLDRTVYHLDGVGALRHLESILAIKEIDAIQWVPGDGQPPLREWIELLQRIQSAGKGLHIYCSAEEVRLFHERLKPGGVFYDVYADTEREARDLLNWLDRNT